MKKTTALALGAGALALLAAPLTSLAAPKDMAKPQKSIGGPQAPCLAATTTPANELPDLQVVVENVFCTQGYLQLKIRLKEATPNSAECPFFTTFEMDGISFPGSPRLTTFDLHTGTVFHDTLYNVSDGIHTVVLKIDSGGDVFEINENNNTTTLNVNCLNENANAGSESPQDEAPSTKPAMKGKPGKALKIQPAPTRRKLERR